MFTMNVYAQKKNCTAEVIITVENIKDTNSIFISESRSINASNTSRQGNVMHYSLEPSHDYLLIFEDEEVSKIIMIKTSELCKSTLRLTVDMNKYDSMTAVWRNGKYVYEYFLD